MGNTTLYFGASIGMYLLLTSVLGMQFITDFLRLKRPTPLMRTAGIAMLFDSMSLIMDMVAFTTGTSDHLWHIIEVNVVDGLAWLVLLSIGEIMVHGMIPKKMAAAGTTIILAGVIATLVFGRWLADILIPIIAVIFFCMFIYQVARVVRHDRQLADLYSSIENRKGSWYVWMSLPFALEISMWYIHQDELDNYSFQIGYNILMVFFWIYIGRFVCTHKPLEPLVEEPMEQETAPDAPPFATVITAGTAAARDTAGAAERTAELRRQLESLMETERLYLDPDLNIIRLCRLLGTNRTYLSQLLNNDMHKTFHQYVNTLRIDHAKHLLETTDEKVGIIAALSGFGSPEVMTRLFRQYTDTTPREYRRRAKENG